MTEVVDLAPRGSEIDLEHADWDPPRAAAACDLCHGSLGVEYHVAGATAVVCSACRRRVDASLGLPPSAWRLTRAAVYGVVAGLAAAVAVAALLALKIPMLGVGSVGAAILIALAVRHGSGGAGGRLFQVLASGLTYLTIGVLVALHAASIKHAPDASGALADGVPRLPLLWAIVRSAPVAPIAFARTGALGVIVLGISLFEAWRITRARVVQVAGPYRRSPSGDRPERPCCNGCGGELATTLGACPWCARFSQADELRRLATEAESAVARGDSPAALASWRAVLDRLPAGARQRALVEACLDHVSRGPGGASAAPTSDPRAPSTARSAQAAPAASSSGRWGRTLGVLGAGALVLWKLKVVFVFVFGKLKLLLLGFSKMGTLLSMLASVGVYWTIWGWKFAVGFVLMIYVHEMGHVAALRRLGIAATAPMFVPGVGAFVRLKQYPSSPREDAEVGLAGPFWGMAASLIVLAVGYLAHLPLFMALAQVGGWMNLFNLVPVWQLDGGRGFRALSRGQRWAVCAVAGAMLLLTQEPILLILLAFAVFRALSRKDQATQANWSVFTEFAVLVATLALLTKVTVPR